MVGLRGRGVHSGIVTQGASSLGVAGFHYTELTSSPRSIIGAVSSTLSLDVRPPIALG